MSLVSIEAVFEKHSEHRGSSLIIKQKNNLYIITILKNIQYKTILTVSVRDVP